MPERVMLTEFQRSAGNMDIGENTKAAIIANVKLNASKGKPSYNCGGY